MEKIEDFVMYSALLVYAGTWLIFAHLIIPSHWLITGSIPAILHGLGHLYEIRIKGHCYLSADPTAIPLGIAGTVLAYLYLLVTSNLPESGFFQMVQLFLFSFGIGHLAALLYAFLLTSLLSFFNR